MATGGFPQWAHFAIGLQGISTLHELDTFLLEQLNINPNSEFDDYVDW